MEQAEKQNLYNPADRPLVTFDANIVIALRNNEADAQPACQLLTLNRADVIAVNVTVSTAIEEQRSDEKQENWLSCTRHYIRHHYFRSSARDRA